MWTRFMDMYSGGDCKESPYEKIYIEAAEDEAVIIFFNRFGHSPDRVTCACCGSDYSYDDYPNLRVASGYDRGCRALEHPRDPKTGLYKDMSGDEYFQNHFYIEDGEVPAKGYAASNFRRWNKYQSLEEYCAREDVLVIPALEIKDSDRTGVVPDQGYVWVD